MEATISSEPHPASSVVWPKAGADPSAGPSEPSGCSQRQAAFGHAQTNETESHRSNHEEPETHESKAGGTVNTLLRLDGELARMRGFIRWPFFLSCFSGFSWFQQQALQSSARS